jgi:ABC-type transport system involved in cytochrome c biogenesis permease subunit
MAKRFSKFLARTDLFFWSIMYLMVLLVAGTLAQKWIGLYQAQEMFFSAWVIWLGGIIPVPGTMAVLAFITAGLVARVFVYPWVWEKTGTIVIHFAALVLLLGGFVMSMLTEEGAVVLAEGESKAYVTDYFDVELVIGDQLLIVPENELRAGRTISDDLLPFDIEIVAYHHHAEPILLDGKIWVKSLPRLTIEEENLSALILKAGADDLVVFEELPMPVKIDHEGQEYEFKLRHVRRLLPFAIELTDFTREVYPGTDQPRSYYSDVVIHDGGVRWPSRIGMNEPLRYKGYSFYQSSFLQGGLGERSVLAAVQNEGRLFPYIASILLALGMLITVVQRWAGLMKKGVSVFILFCVLAGVPQFAFAQNQDETSVVAGVENDVFLIDDFSQQAVWYEGRVQPIESVARIVLRDFSGGESLGILSASEWLALVFFVPDQAADLPVFKIRQPDILHAIGLPPQGEGRFYSFNELRTAMALHMDELGDLWQIPRDELTKSQRSVLDLQRQLIVYDGLRDLEPAEQGSYDARRVQAEWFYERLNLHSVSLVFYVLAGLVLLSTRYGGVASQVLLAGGACVHMLALVMRIYILERPPVSSLYESILFVGLIVVLSALLIAWRYKSKSGLLIGAVGGALLQLIGASYAGTVQTMGVLVPVLNTNFWLVTHVIVITIGYGLCLVAGMLAHLDLWRRLRGVGVSFEKQVIAFGLLALLFTAIGTILGGIWADQSWGRFWGWDPKENGAMLICLWLIACLHGRLGGVLKPLWFAASMALLPVIVALAWFGVNLLNVGLHSYGFTEGIAAGLFGFVALEIVIIMTIVLGVMRKGG